MNETTIKLILVRHGEAASGDSDSVRRFLGEDDDAKATERSARDIQVDGTNILSFIERAGGTRPGCWAHARRGLALCARSGDQVAFAGVKLMAPLFEVERASKEAGENAEQRKVRRLAESQPTAYNRGEPLGTPVAVCTLG